MSDLDYSPALNEDGTEFDIVKAAEIAKSCSDAGLRAALEVIAEWQTHGPLRERDADAIVRVARAALASSPALAGLDCYEDYKRGFIDGVEHAAALASSPAPAGLDDVLATLEKRAAAVDHGSIEDGPAFARGLRYAIEQLRAATRPAEDAGA